MLILKIIGWIICGFFAYGILKGNMKHFLESLKCVRHDGKGETLCWIFGIVGPIGLIAALSISLVERQRFGFCLRMPKELKKGYGKRT